jgi:phosphoglycolate phosphatase
MPGPVRAVLFDFDGTLADSYGAITASVNHVRGLHGLPALPEAEIRGLVGLGLARLMRDVVPDQDPDAAAAEYRRHHPTVMETRTRLFPAVAATLAELRSRGLKLAVCSNKAVAFTRHLCATLGIAEYLDAVLGPEDVGGRAKPLPDMLLTALERLGVEPAEAVYVGDMTVDVETARAAGVPVWVVPSGSNDRATLEAAGPDRVLDEFGELARRLS